MNFTNQMSDGKKDKSYNEKFEVSVWQMLMKHLDNETRTDGEEVFTVKDVSKLVIGIMEFYEKYNKEI